jgi:hypothetical protein
MEGNCDCFVKGKVAAENRRQIQGLKKYVRSEDSDLPVIVYTL